MNANKEKFYESLAENLLNDYSKYEDEYDIFNLFIENIIKIGHKKDEINILLKHPFYLNQYYSVCIDGELNKNFRKDKLEKEKETKSTALASYLNDKDQQIIYFNKKYLCQKENLDLINKKVVFSFIAIPLRIKEVVIGFLVLINDEKEDFYDNKKLTLLAFSVKATSDLHNYRRDKSIEEINDFAKRYIRHNTDTDDLILYENLKVKIESLYGEVSLKIITRNSITGAYTFTFPKLEDNTVPELIAKELSKNLYKDNIQNSNNKNIQDNIFSVIDKGKNCFLFSLRAESNISTGFILITADRIGQSTKEFVNELVSLIEYKQSTIRKKNRLKAMTNFGKSIATNKYETLQAAFDLVYHVTGEVMYTQSMYVALFNRDTEIITFPLYYENGKKRDDIGERKFNKEEKGRTEEIIITKKPILIETKTASKIWYKKPGRKDHINDPYASWVGVPILNGDDAVGVIVTYHPTEDYLYTDANTVFLENIASHISSLITRITLKNLNTMIAQKEKLLADFLYAKDINHNFGNILSGLRIGLNNTIKDIQKTIETGEKSHLLYTKSFLDKLYRSVDQATIDIKNITNNEPQEINLPKLAKERLEEVVIESDLKDKIQYGVINELTGKDAILSSQRGNISLCLHLLIKNASDAIEKALRNKNSDNFYIFVKIYMKGYYLIIDIIDNGTPIDIKIENRLFEINTSTNGENRGYGLWRAKYICEKEIQGHLELVKSEDKTDKIFRITISKYNEFASKKIAVVVEDDIVWQSILIRVLENNQFKVLTFNNVKEARKNCDESIKIDLIFLDISLSSNELIKNNGLSSPNVDGLTLIDDYAKYYPKAIIILLSAYPEKAYQYIHKVKFIVNKNDLSKEDDIVNLLKDINLN